MDPPAAFSDLLKLMEEQKRSMNQLIEEQTRFMNQLKEEQTRSMNQQTQILTSILNKFEDEDHMEKGKGEQRVTKKDEQLNESPAPCPSSSSPYYRLEIEGVVGVEEHGTADCDTRGKPRTSHTLTAGKPLNIRVILKKDEEKVPSDDPLANVRVQLVVLDDDFHIQHTSRPWWPPEDFTEHCMHLNQNQKDPGRKIMVVDKGEFRLNAGRGAPQEGATINVNSKKKPVKLGVRIHPDSQKKIPRVLEAASNSFRVKDPPRVKKDKTDQGVTTGKRPMNADNESSPKAQESKRFRVVPPRASAPNSDQGLPNSVQTEIMVQVVVKVIRVLYSQITSTPIHRGTTPWLLLRLMISLVRR